MVGEHGLIKGFPDNWMHFNVSSPSVRVDDVVPPDVPVCMLKADVEGYEPAVLRTAERLLSSGRVHAVQLEVTTSPDRRVASETVEALAHLETLGFTVRQLPRRMDNNARPFDSLPAFPSARAVPGCKKSRAAQAGRRGGDAIQACVPLRHQHLLDEPGREAPAAPRAEREFR